MKEQRKQNDSRSQEKKVILFLSSCVSIPSADQGARCLGLTRVSLRRETESDIDELRTDHRVGNR